MLTERIRLPVIQKNSEICPACNGKGFRYKVAPDSLRQARTDAGLSLRQFAVRVNLSAGYISDVEKGRRACTPTIEQFYRDLLPVSKTTNKKKGK